MSNITIDGKNFHVTGRNIIIRNGTVTVDGITITTGLVGDVHVPGDARIEPGRHVGQYPGEPRTCSAHGDFEPCQECKRIRDRREP